MGQSIGDTARHITMNEMMKRMMGDKGEEQVHTAWGKEVVDVTHHLLILLLV